MKICTKCGKEKPETEFYKDSSRKDGLFLWCKTCKKEYDVEYDNAHKERASKLHSEWNKANREHVNECHEEWLKAHPGYMQRMGRKYTLRRHDIDALQYDTLLVSQGGKCAICGRDKARGKGTWHIDHDHQTGQVRGLLCTSCNTGIGQLQDNPFLIRKAVEYLEATAQEHSLLAVGD